MYQISHSYDRNKVGMVRECKYSVSSSQIERG